MESKKMSSGEFQQLENVRLLRESGWYASSGARLYKTRTTSQNGMLSVMITAYAKEIRLTLMKASVAGQELEIVKERTYPMGDILEAASLGMQFLLEEFVGKTVVVCWHPTMGQPTRVVGIFKTAYYDRLSLTNGIDSIEVKLLFAPKVELAD